MLVVALIGIVIDEVNLDVNCHFVGNRRIGCIKIGADVTEERSSVVFDKKLLAKMIVVKVPSVKEPLVSGDYSEKRIVSGWAVGLSIDSTRRGGGEKLTNNVIRKGILGKVIKKYLYY